MSRLARTAGVRMADVARAARVSVMTVSRALRHPDRVAKETRRKIAKAIRDIRYVPNDLAGSLRSDGRSKLAAAVIPSLRNSLFANTLQGMADALGARGYRLVVSDSGYSVRQHNALIRALLSQRPSGLILHDPVGSREIRKLLASSDVPVVEVGDLPARAFDMAVSYSNFLAAKAITDHLLDRGYRRIGFVSLPQRMSARTRRRLDGYRAALEQAGIAPDRRYVLEIAEGFENGAKALHRLLLESKPPVDAIFCAGDVHAAGAILECRKLGIEVPAQVAIAGFDDLEIATALQPSLTALRIPRYKIGYRAAQLILSRIENGEASKPIIEDLGFELICRQST